MWFPFVQFTASLILHTRTHTAFAIFIWFAITHYCHLQYCNIIVTTTTHITPFHRYQHHFRHQFHVCTARVCSCLFNHFILLVSYQFNTAITNSAKSILHNVKLKCFLGKMSTGHYDTWQLKSMILDFSPSNLNKY